MSPGCPRSLLPYLFLGFGSHIISVVSIFLKINGFLSKIFFEVFSSFMKIDPLYKMSCKYISMSYTPILILENITEENLFRISLKILFPFIHYNSVT